MEYKYDDPNEAAHQERDNLTNEMVMKVLWILIPLVIGGVVSMFTNVHQDVQIVVWGVLFLIVVFGLWSHNARVIRKRREETDKVRWDKLNSNLDERFDKLDEKFDKVDKRFDEVDLRFDMAEDTDKTLLRNEIIKFHRDWAEDKGYITLEALEYLDRIHDQYKKLGGNSTGDKLWEELHKLPVKEKRQQG